MQFRRSAIHLAQILAALAALAGAPALAQTQARVSVAWSKVERISKTTATLQVVVNPPLRRGSPIHNRVFEALRNLNCDYVRFVPWLPYPKLGVAELAPPHAGKTSWNFSLIDPLTVDFLNATAARGHSVVLNFSTIPEWMFVTPKPVPYPADPDEVYWDYEQGTKLRDPSMKEVADYYARLVSWYAKGGFTDEYGKWHASGYHYPIAYWEVLNEVDSEHEMSPEFYTRLYDAVVKAIHAVSPQTKFVGMALSAPSSEPGFFEYFLNPKNHLPDTPLDMISYHFYATPSTQEPTAAWPYTFFAQADGFLNVVHYIESIRKRLSPTTRTDIDELGSILPYDTAAHLVRPIPNFYWNLSGAMYAYLYARLTRMGIDVVGESQLVGYPTQYPSVSMVDWKTGQPNARYWALKLLHDNFGPGDKLVETGFGTSATYAQGFITPGGAHKILLINKRNRPAIISLPGAAGAREEYVNQETGSKGIGTANLVSDEVVLGGFEVTVVTLP